MNPIQKAALSRIDGSQRKRNRRRNCSIRGIHVRHSCGIGVGWLRIVSELNEYRVGHTGRKQAGSCVCDRGGATRLVGGYGRVGSIESHLDRAGHESREIVIDSHGESGGVVDESAYVRRRNAGRCVRLESTRRCQIVD